MAPHCSTLAWKIPWTEEPGRLQSLGSLRVRHDWETPLSLFSFMHWRRKWQPTPVFLPGESQGRGSPVGGRLWGRTESDTTEATQQQQQQLAVLVLSRGMQDFQFQLANSQLWHMGSSSLTRDLTLAPCLGSAESQPLDHEGSLNLLYS